MTFHFVPNQENQNKKTSCVCWCGVHVLCMCMCMCMCMCIFPPETSEITNYTNNEKMERNIWPEWLVP